MDAHAFSHTFARRSLYKRAHTDPKLAEWIKQNDPLYGQRAKLTRFENTVNDVIVTVCLPLGSSIEFIIGNILNLVEGQSPVKRSTFGQFYDDIIYRIFDPFHGKRLLYDLSSVGTTRGNSDTPIAASN